MAITHLKSRKAVFDSVEKRSGWSVLIIGAGINGAGLFRELAAQGVDCLLVERGDFGSGTSAAPSRLIHGGLKYLETGEFDLVAESASERNYLLRNAPHYVKPLEAVVPVYSRLGGILGAGLRFAKLTTRSFERGGLVIRLGLSLYDWLGRRQRVLPRHKYYGRRKTLSRLPSLRSDIVGTGCYYDARVTYAERLNMELVQDAQAAYPDGALALNYTEVTGKTNTGIEVKDLETGQFFEIAAHVVVNATGPWIDQVNNTLGIPSNYIGGHKGSHLVLDHPKLCAELDGRMVYFGASDGRICLAYPFFGRVLVGSTDIPIEDPETASTDNSEINYILKQVQYLFPDLTISRENILYHYVGVRPLPAVQADDPGEVPRSHSVQVDSLKVEGEPSIFSLIGGKWTTFRSFSEQVGDDILQRLGRTRVTHTHEQPIGGGYGYPKEQASIDQYVDHLADNYDLTRDDAKRLFERYGTRAVNVAVMIVDSGHSRLSSLPDYFFGEILFFCRKEAVCSLTDVLLRRTNLALIGRIDQAILEELASILSNELNWSESTRDAAVNNAIRICADHGLKF